MVRLDQESAMGEPSLGTPQSERPPEDRLDSWKEIAAYLNRDVTTAQRWEKREGMPVHRHLHDRMGSVYASRADWTRGCAAGIFGQGRRTGTTPVARSLLPAHAASRTPRPRLSRWRFVLLLAAVASRWQLARASGCRERSTSGETPSPMHDFRRSRTSMEWSRPLRCPATAISWRFCRTGTDQWTSGLRRSDRVSSTT